MLTDDHIRAALELAADRAPDPAVVRRALDGATVRARQRRSLLLAGTAAGVVATAGAAAPVLLRDRREPPSTPDVTSTPPASPGAPIGSVRPSVRFLLGYQLGWTPTGYRERLRAIAPPPDRAADTLMWERTWRGSDRQDRDADYARITLGRSHASSTQSLAGLPRVQVNGVSAWIGLDDHPLQWNGVYWTDPDDPEYVLQVRAKGAATRWTEETMLRLAGAVRRDRNVTVDVPVQPGWLPDPRLRVAGGVNEGKSAKQWSVTAIFGRPDGAMVPINQLSVTVGVPAALDAIVAQPTGPTSRWPVRDRTGVGVLARTAGTDGSPVWRGWRRFDIGGGLAARVGIGWSDEITRRTIDSRWRFGGSRCPERFGGG